MSFNYSFYISALSEGGEGKRWILDVFENFLEHPRFIIYAKDIIYISCCYWILLYMDMFHSNLRFRPTSILDTEHTNLFDIMSWVNCICSLLSHQPSPINIIAQNVTQRLRGYFQGPFFSK